MALPYLPKWLYEIMPYIYAVVGIAVAVLTQDRLAVLSGLVLAALGGYLWLLRRHHRRRHAEAQARIDARLNRARQERISGYR